ncbi:MAG: DUF3331 domain-containing protein [Pandoraea sp.]|nr:DUF3331 domain-containing protein [Pandoraea sp.]MDR3399554.1 DUF3331 domain-containing protein [Pandoraea sp.]
MLNAISDFVVDPWSSTLAAIEHFSSTGAASRPQGDSVHRRAPRRASRCTSGQPRKYPFSIRLIERLPNSFVTLAWHDPTLCNYGEQLWAPTPAQRAGRCALSGRRIHEGALVYMPRTYGKTHLPLNANEMILAVVLHAAMGIALPASMVDPAEAV